MTGLEHDPDELLKKAGWTATRHIDAAPDLAALDAAAYEVTASVRSLIANMSGLTVRYTRRGRTDTIWIEPNRAVELSFKSWVDDYSSRVGAALVPVGYSNHNHLLLMVDGSARWFGAFDDEFGKLGIDEHQMIDRIANDRGFIG
jgi:SUKH-3 immunity protein